MQSSKVCWPPTISLLRGARRGANIEKYITKKQSEDEAMEVENFFLDSQYPKSQSLLRIAIMNAHPKKPAAAVPKQSIIPPIRPK